MTAPARADKPTADASMDGRPPSARNRRGSALIIVIWVIGLMSILVSSFAFDAHLEARTTSYYRKRVRATHLAYSGIEIAKLLMAMSPRVDPRAELSPDDANRWYTDAQSLVRGGGLTRTYQLGAGEVRLEIVTEEARRNVNQLRREEDWEPILDAVGIPEERWPVLIESFLDWIDADDEPRADGAETADYYETLEPPYRARNGELYTVEELLLVRGFTRAMLEGGPLEDSGTEDPVMIMSGGLGRILTVFGDRRININAASYHVLLTLPDPTNDADLVARAVIEERTPDPDLDGEAQDRYFKDDADAIARVPGLGHPARREFWTTSVSAIYRISAVGRVENVERRVWCIAQTTGETLTILRWIEDD